MAGAAEDLLPPLRLVSAKLPGGVAGVRMAGSEELAALLGADSLITRVAEQAIGRESRPVRAIMFDKSPEVNWALGWHQDRTICVRERVDTAGLGPWTVKQGLIHVAPPFEVTARMVTLRIHLDDVPQDNAPLLIAPGSHRYGYVAEERIASVVERCGVRTCTARAGDIWVYSTPILHASEASRSACRRRVLQIDYSADQLPGGLEWLGL